MKIDLTGKVAVVTGGGGILCSVMAESLAANGAKVAILDLREENAHRRHQQRNRQRSSRSFSQIRRKCSR